MVHDPPEDGADLVPAPNESALLPPMGTSNDLHPIVVGTTVAHGEPVLDNAPLPEPPNCEPLAPDTLSTSDPSLHHDLSSVLPDVREIVLEVEEAVNRAESDIPIEDVGHSIGSVVEEVTLELTEVEVWDVVDSTGKHIIETVPVDEPESDDNAILDDEIFDAVIEAPVIVAIEEDVEDRIEDAVSGEGAPLWLIIMGLIIWCSFIMLLIWATLIMAHTINWSCIEMFTAVALPMPPKEWLDLVHLPQGFSLTQAKSIDFTSGGVVAPAVLGFANFIWFKVGRKLSSDPVEEVDADIDPKYDIKKQGQGTYDIAKILRLLRTFQPRLILLAALLLSSALAATLLSNVLGYKAIPANADDINLASEELLYQIVYIPGLLLGALCAMTSATTTALLLVLLERRAIARKKIQKILAIERERGIIEDLSPVELETTHSRANYVSFPRFHTGRRLFSRGGREIFSMSRRGTSEELEPLLSQTRSDLVVSTPMGKWHWPSFRISKLFSRPAKHGDETQPLLAASALNENARVLDIPQAASSSIHWSLPRFWLPTWHLSKSVAREDVERGSDDQADISGPSFGEVATTPIARQPRTSWRFPAYGTMISQRYSIVSTTTTTEQEQTHTTQTSPDQRDLDLALSPSQVLRPHWRFPNIRALRWPTGSWRSERVRRDLEDASETSSLLSEVDTEEFALADVQRTPSFWTIPSFRGYYTAPSSKTAPNDRPSSAVPGSLEMSEAAGSSDVLVSGESATSSGYGWSFGMPHIGFGSKSKVYLAHVGEGSNDLEAGHSISEQTPTRILHEETRLLSATAQPDFTILVSNVTEQQVPVCSNVPNVVRPVSSRWLWPRPHLGWSRSDSSNVEESTNFAPIVSVLGEEAIGNVHGETDLLNPTARGVELEVADTVSQDMGIIHATGLHKATEGRTRAIWWLPSFGLGSWSGNVNQDQIGTTTGVARLEAEGRLVGDSHEETGVSTTSNAQADINGGRENGELDEVSGNTDSKGRRSWWFPGFRFQTSTKQSPDLVNEQNHTQDQEALEVTHGTFSHTLDHGSSSMSPISTLRQSQIVSVDDEGITTISAITTLRRIHSSVAIPDVSDLVAGPAVRELIDAELVQEPPRFKAPEHAKGHRKKHSFSWFPSFQFPLVLVDIPPKEIKRSTLQHSLEQETVSSEELASAARTLSASEALNLAIGAQSVSSATVVPTAHQSSSGSSEAHSAMTDTWTYSKQGESSRTHEHSANGEPHIKSLEAASRVEAPVPSIRWTMPRIQLPRFSTGWYESSTQEEGSMSISAAHNQVTHKGLAPSPTMVVSPSKKGKEVEQYVDQFESTISALHFQEPEIPVVIQEESIVVQPSPILSDDAPTRQKADLGTGWAPWGTFRAKAPDLESGLASRTLTPPRDTKPRTWWTPSPGPYLSKQRVAGESQDLDSGPSPTRADGDRSSWRAGTWWDLTWPHLVDVENLQPPFTQAVVAPHQASVSSTLSSSHEYNLEARGIITTSVLDPQTFAAGPSETYSKKRPLWSLGRTSMQLPQPSPVSIMLPGYLSPRITNTRTNMSEILGRHESDAEIDESVARMWKVGGSQQLLIEGPPNLKTHRMVDGDADAATVGSVATVKARGWPWSQDHDFKAEDQGEGFWMSGSQRRVEEDLNMDIDGQKTGRTALPDNEDDQETEIGAGGSYDSLVRLRRSLQKGKSRMRDESEDASVVTMFHDDRDGHEKDRVEHNASPGTDHHHSHGHDQSNVHSQHKYGHGHQHTQNATRDHRNHSTSSHIHQQGHHTSHLHHDEHHPISTHGHHRVQHQTHPQSSSHPHRATSSNSPLHAASHSHTDARSQAQTDTHNHGHAHSTPSIFVPNQQVTPTRTYTPRRLSLTSIRSDKLGQEIETEPAVEIQQYLGF